ncbi:hypothetical protein ACFOOL_14270 [Devosia honganensis]|uniref:Major capsid protein n=1 Tax=Devosia honganensis TaxID=1610527 RepID=A0ABV7X5T3_9HYPH
MKNVNRLQTRPVKFPRSKRNHAIAKITSVKPGVCAPIAAIPMFREDAIVGRRSSDGKWNSSRISFAIEMAETKDLIINKVRARVTAYCVPWLAFERFAGSRDEFDRSYAGEEGLAGQVIPFVETHTMGAYGASEFYKTLGLHAEPGTDVNSMYLEAYNAVWNYRAKNRSEQITPRSRLTETLAPAFWPAGRFEHLVPDFDAAVMDGQVALNVVEGRLPVSGLGLGTVGGIASRDVYETGKEDMVQYARGTQERLFVEMDGDTSRPAIFAEMAANGVTISLANIEMAKQVQAFAKLRAKYEGHDDDYIIDTFLMNGLSLPDQALKQPFLIADRTFTFRQAKRYATDHGNLDEAAVSGIATGDITLRVPKLDVGGIVIVQVEILPDQLFERQQDPFLHSTAVDQWPQALRDFADPEKVDVVVNGEIDTDHSDPDGLFAYGPLNWKWNAFGPGIGGKFLKPEVGGGTNVLRQRFWAHEEVDPALAESFYLCQELTTSIFLDETSDPFELMVQGNVVLDGLTQFGGMLIEATDNYDKVMGQMDHTRVKDEA